MSEAIRRMLGDTLVKAIDGFFAAVGRLAAALIRSDAAGVDAAIAECREALGLWLALLVERLDGRNAAQLVQLHERVDAIERRLSPARDSYDGGHDEMGLPAR